jgi:hypothetical protein
MLEEPFLAAYGDEEMKRQKFVPGEDHSRELEQTEKSLERLRWDPTTDSSTTKRCTGASSRADRPEE